MHPAGRAFLLVLLILAILGTGFAVIGLRDADCRSKRAVVVEKIEGNLRIFRQRAAVVTGMARSLAGTADPDRAAQVTEQLLFERDRLERLVEVLRVQLDRYDESPRPWLLAEKTVLDTKTIRGEVDVVMKVTRGESSR